MTDKDILVVISELLRKHDQQSEILNQHSVILTEHSEILKQHSELIKETNTTLGEFVNVSIRQFEWQHQNAEQQMNFNEKFLEKLDVIANKL